MDCDSTFQSVRKGKIVQNKVAKEGVVGDSAWRHLPKKPWFKLIMISGFKIQKIISNIAFPFFIAINKLSKNFVIKIH